MFGFGLRGRVRGKGRGRVRVRGEVDRLVWQEAVVDVPVGELGRGLERLLEVGDVVVLGVTLLQPAQDLDLVGLGLG